MRIVRLACATAVLALVVAHRPALATPDVEPTCQDRCNQLYIACHEANQPWERCWGLLDGCLFGCRVPRPE